MAEADMPALRRGSQPRGETWGDWVGTATASGELTSSSGARRDTSDVSPSVEMARQGTCAALFEGLLHNREELESRLHTPGLTDSELVLAAYHRWGDRVLDELK